MNKENNLTCYMQVKVLLYILAATVLLRIILAQFNVTGLIITIIDYSFVIYLVFSFFYDKYNIGFRIKCILFDVTIAFLLYLGYGMLLVIALYLGELVIGFFRYIVF